MEAHLQGHLERLAPQDAKTRAIVEQMKQRRKRAMPAPPTRWARAELPEPVKRAMRLSARMMTQASYWV